MPITDLFTNGYEDDHGRSRHGIDGKKSAERTNRVQHCLSRTNRGSGVRNRKRSAAQIPFTVQDGAGDGFGTGYGVPHDFAGRRLHIGQSGDSGSSEVFPNEQNGAVCNKNIILMHGTGVQVIKILFLCQKCPVGNKNNITMSHNKTASVKVCNRRAYYSARVLTTPGLCRNLYV